MCTFVNVSVVIYIRQIHIHKSLSISLPFLGAAHIPLLVILGQ